MLTFRQVFIKTVMIKAGVNHDYWSDFLCEPLLAFPESIPA